MSRVRAIRAALAATPLLLASGCSGDARSPVDSRGLVPDRGGADAAPDQRTALEARAARDRSIVDGAIPVTDARTDGSGPLAATVVAGQYQLTDKSKPIAVFWTVTSQSALRTDLSDGKEAASARDVLVEKGAIHLVGREYNSSKQYSEPLYWVAQGTKTTRSVLPEATAGGEARGLVSDGNELSIVGIRTASTGAQAVLWNRDALGAMRVQALSTGTDPAEAEVVTLQQGRRVAVGFEGQRYSERPRQWVVDQGQVTASFLPLPSGTVAGKAYGVFAVNGKTILVAGYARHGDLQTGYNTAVFWTVDGSGASPTALESDAVSSEASGICQDGTGVLVVGVHGNFPKYQAAHWTFDGKAMRLDLSQGGVLDRGSQLRCGGGISHVAGEYVDANYFSHGLLWTVQGAAVTERDLAGGTGFASAYGLWVP